MTTIGRISVAPCGHTGEVIIGTYVKCVQGCEGPAFVPRRGEVGHVLNCACQNCKIRRVAKYIVLRDRDGKDWAKIEWDGATDVVVGKSGKSGSIKHYQFLDENGKVVAKGNTSAALYPGEFKINVKYMMDTSVAMVKNAITQEGEVFINYYFGIPVTASVPGTMVSYPMTKNIP